MTSAWIVSGQIGFGGARNAIIVRMSSSRCSLEDWLQGRNESRLPLTKDRHATPLQQHFSSNRRAADPDAPAESGLRSRKKISVTT